MMYLIPERTEHEKADFKIVTYNFICNLIPFKLTSIV
jgi:hypothetical protein